MKNKKEKLNYLFQKIEQNALKDVEEFFRQYPEFAESKDQLRSINDWTPTYYCARYGYIDLLRFFFEKVQMNDDKSFLLLLSIHSGSLPVIYYLFNTDTVQTYELMMMLYSSCNLGKINLGLFIMLRGAMVYDDVTSNSNEDLNPTAFCYNMSYDIVNGKKDYYDRNGVMIFEESTEVKTLAEFQARRSQREKTIFVLSQGNSKMQEKVRILTLFRSFNYVLLKEFKKWGVTPILDEKHPKSNFFDCIDIIEKNEYLKKMFERYLFTRRSD